MALDFSHLKKMSFKKKAIILIFLAVINALGSGALAIYFDERFIWPAIFLPSFFLLLLITQLRTES